MQVKKIQAYIERYRDWLPTRAAEQRLYYWESQQHWQREWDLAAPNLREVYDRSLDNRQTRRLWAREAYDPKRMMLAFLDNEPEFVRSIFLDLFNEAKEIEGRLGRFLFYCEEMMAHYREAHPRTKDTGHYHDPEMVSLYLSFQYPAAYAPYEATRFLQLLRQLGAANIPLVGDFARHCKLMRTLQTFLNKDGQVLARHTARLRPNRDYAGESLLLSFDFACFVTDNPL